MTVRVKICGVNDAAAFDATVATGADWLGFVFYPPSPRAVTPPQAASLSSRHAGGPLRVGLFVDPSEDAVAAALAALPLDVLQLYVAPERAVALRQRFGVPVWRAVGVAAAEDLPREADGVDALLIEAKPPPGADRPGGNATALDWALLAGWTPPGPWLLAGGLTPDTVAEAVRVSGAAMVDVSSGVERRRGVKDPDLVAAFVTAARQAHGDRMWADSHHTTSSWPGLTRPATP